MLFEQPGLSRHHHRSGTLSDRRVASCYISQVCHSFISFGNRCPLALKNDELIYLLPQHHGEKSSCKPSLILIDTILASAYI